MLAICGQRAQGFALLGPRTDMAGLPATYSDTWQVPAIGYDLPGDIGTPKRYGQGYRRNLPVMYYSFNESFSGFFGVQGEQAVISAMNTLNSSFTNNNRLSLDGYSLDLTEFPDNSQSMNLTAESLALTDVKSTTLFLMMEQLGLAEPERYVWTLHDRDLPSGGKCPFDMLYLVVQRNYAFTPSPLTQIQNSSYINDTLYTYRILEFCSPPSPPDSVTAPVAVDPFADTFTAVAGMGQGLGVTAVTASGGIAWSSSEVGGFYNGLTRDDVGGLRYLMSSNNIVFEDTFPQSLLEDTNTSPGALQVLQTSDLGALLSFAQTNPPSVVSNTFPGIVIDTVSNYFTVVSNPVISSYFTNFPGSAAGAPPVFVIKTNSFTFVLQSNFAYTFDNVVIVHEHTNTIAQLTTVTLAALKGAPAGTGFFTNTTVKNIVLTNVISGDYYIVPPNSCGFQFVQTLLSNNRAGSTTNVIATATNALTGFVGSESIVTYFTNNWYTYFACNLETSPPSYYQGVGRIKFVRVADENLDSLTGFFRQPITNTYSMVWWNPTNGQLGTRTFQRIVTQPDFMFAGIDLTSPNIPQIGVNPGARNVNFDINNIIPNDAGPGVIFPPTTISFNTVEDVFGNGSLAANGLSTNEFISEVNQGSLLAWGSFDGSTNPPIVYPNGTSLQNLENGLVLTVTPSTLPDGTNGVAYPTTTLSATGGTPPYTWSMAGTQLPLGLAFTTNGVSAVIFGTPNGNPSGVYDFMIQLTDSQKRTADLSYSINIH